MRARGCRAGLAFLWLCLCVGAAWAQGIPGLSSVTLDPGSVIGGTSVTGRVTLNRPTRRVGTVVWLFSSDPATASVPGKVTLPPGTTTKTFPVTTHLVATLKTVRIFAFHGGGMRAAVLEVLVATRGAGAGAALEVGAAVPAAARLGDPKPANTGAQPAAAALPPPVPYFLREVEDVDRDDRAIRRVAEDNSLDVADAAGTALLRLGAAGPAILLDPTAQDPVDGVGLARLLRVEVSRAGAAVVALRADNTLGIYRLESGRLTRLALLTDPMDPREVAISDAGQIAYVARTAAGALAVFQAAAGAGQPVPLDALVGDASVQGIRNLQWNESGDLVLLLDLLRPDRTTAQAIVRKTAVGVAAVVTTGQVVLRGRGGSATGGLVGLRRPRIGRDGTVAFVGNSSPFGDFFANFYVARPGRAPEPLLAHSDWNLDPDSLDLQIADDGTIALRAAPDNQIDSRLYIAAPGGEASLIALGRLVPQGHLVLADGRLFFLAADRALPPGLNGRSPVGLYRLRLAAGRPVGQPEPVAASGQAVPGKPGARLLGVTQVPVLSARVAAFEARFGDPGQPTAAATGFFQVLLDGTLADGSLVSEEGAELPGGNRLAILRDLSYRADGTLVFGGLLPGAGPLVATVTPQAATASAVRTQSVQGVTVAPLLAMGDDLGAGRKLKAVLSPPIALGPDRQLLTARFSQEGGPGGEGLYAIGRDRQAQAVALTGGTALGSAAPFSGFADTNLATAALPADCSTVSALFRLLGAPSVSPDGNVVFKARLDRGGASSFGVFQWSGGDPVTVGLADAMPDTLAVLPDDHPPYDLMRWVAGPAGRAYLMARPAGGGPRLYRRAAPDPSPTGLELLVLPGVTPVTGASPAPLTYLSDFVVSGDGSVFVSGGAVGSPGIFRVDTARLTPVVTTGQPVPRLADGRELRGLAFGSRFGLMPDSARGALLFRADVVSGDTVRRGLFRLGPQGLETVLVEGVGIAGARDLTVETLSDSLDRQSANGTTVFAAFSTKDGWTLFRSRVIRDSQGNVTSVAAAPIAQEHGSLPGVPGFAALDPSPLLNLACRAGPLFSVNDSGGVAFLASNGQRWGVYVLPGGP